MVPNQKSAPSLMSDGSDSFIPTRLAMVDGQIRPNRVVNTALLDQLQTVPRELFVAEGSSTLAYMEGNCPIAQGRVLLAPTVFARMVEALQLQPNDTVLSLGGGTGYGAAIIAGLVRHVTMVEPDARLALQAEAILAQLGTTNQTVQVGQIDRHTSDTYSAIIIEGAVAQISDSIFNQMAAGGRLIAIVGGSATQLGKVTLATKHHDAVSMLTLFEGSAPYLPGCQPRQGFVF